MQSLTLTSSNQHLRDIPSLSALRDLGWTCHPDRFSKFRPLFPNRGYHKHFSDSVGAYPICTDGVHLIAFNRHTGAWTEVHLTNWIGPISKHEVDESDWDWELNCAKVIVVKKKLPNGQYKYIFLSASASKREYVEKPQSGSDLATQGRREQGLAKQKSAKQISSMVDDLVC